jgi:hypothetical protein
LPWFQIGDAGHRLQGLLRRRIPVELVAIHALAHLALGVRGSKSTPVPARCNYC